MVAPPGVESPAALRAAVASGALHGLWWPDHWMGWAPAAAWDDAGPIAAAWVSPDLYADPFVEMVALGTSIRPPLVGTAVTDVVRRHPAGLLQSAESVLRALPGTRLALGIGAGENLNLTPYGLTRAPLTHVAEALHVLRTLRDHGSATHFGPHLTLDRAPAPAPLSRERLTIWLGAHGPRMRALATSAADGWLPVGFSPRQIAATLPTMRPGPPPQGRPPGPPSSPTGSGPADPPSSPAGSPGPAEWPADSASATRPPPEVARPWTAGVCVPVGIVQNVAELKHLCASPALKMLALSWDPAVFRKVGARHPLGDAVDPLRDFIPAHLTRAEARDLLAQVSDEVVVRFIRWGTPAETTNLFADYLEAGVDHLVAWEVTHLADPARRARSLSLLATAWAGVRP